MNVRSILALTSLASVTVIAAGCGAPATSPSENEGTSQEAMKPIGSPPSLPKVSCGGYRAFDTSYFEGSLKELGCTSPRLAYAINAWQNEWVSNCPLSNLNLVQWNVTYNNAPPTSASLDTTGGSTCSSWLSPIPTGYAEVSWDPNCTGSECGALVHFY